MNPIIPKTIDEDWYEIPHDDLIAIKRLEAKRLEIDEKAKNIFNILIQPMMITFLVTTITSQPLGLACNVLVGAFKEPVVSRTSRCLQYFAGDREFG